MSEGLRFIRLDAGHFFELDLQESQATQYGLDPMAIGHAEAQHYADQDNAWTALRGDQVLAVLGVVEQFPGAQGIAFALLGKALGRDHVRLTRFAREEVIGKCPLPRIEAIVKCIDLEPGIEAIGRDLDQADLMRLAMVPENRTAEVRWSLAVGLRPAAILRKFGAAAETHMLMERIR